MVTDKRSTTVAIFSVQLPHIDTTASTHRAIATKLILADVTFSLPQPHAYRRRRQLFRSTPPLPSVRQHSAERCSHEVTALPSGTGHGLGGPQDPDGLLRTVQIGGAQCPPQCLVLGARPAITHTPRTVASPEYFIVVRVSCFPGQSVVVLPQSVTYRATKGHTSLFSVDHCCVWGQRYDHREVFSTAASSPYRSAHLAGRLLLCSHLHTLPSAVRGLLCPLSPLALPAL